MDIFDKFIVVEEKAITDCIVEYKSSSCHAQRCTHEHVNHSKNNSKSLSKFAEIEFQIDQTILTLRDIRNASADVPLAQIIQWTKGTEKFETKILNMGGTAYFYLYQLSTIVIRILKKRENTENPCPPLSSPDDELTVHIGDKQISVSAHWLMFQSSVIRRMLSVEMREKQQRSLTLNELGVDMEQFMEFLEYISSVAIYQPILPNPKNVLMLLKLADYFQVDWLKSRCETHLINCVEIPLIDRFFLIDRYHLNDFKIFFEHLGADKLLAFCKAHRERFLPGKAAVSNELLVEMLSWICQ